MHQNRAIITETNITDNASLKAIWKEVFNDADGYINAFLLHHHHHIGLVYRENDAIVSMLFLIPCFLNEQKGYYVYACATLPLFREKGYMTKLLDAAYEKACMENAFGLILIPVNSSLFNYYGKLGYQLFSKIDESDFDAKTASTSGFDFIKISNIEKISNLRHRFYGTPSDVHFEPEHLAFIQSASYDKQGSLLILTSEKQEGYAFCHQDKIKKEVFVLEWALISATLRKDIPRFCKGICQHFQIQRLTIRSKCGLNLGNERDFTMIRKCNMQQQLSENYYFNLGMD